VSRATRDFTLPTELTDREREIVTLLAHGVSGKAISVQLRISTATVRTHREHILRKLRIHSTTELVASVFDLRAVVATIRQLGN
jgi:DNA-binding NarL/FixJ family response regulator